MVQIHNYDTIGLFENKNDKKKYKIGIGFVMLGLVLMTLLLIILRSPKGRIEDLMLNSKSSVSVSSKTAGIFFLAINDRVF